MEPFIILAAGILGLVFGSFLNVCISRIPRDESIVSPGSHCRTCGTAVAWHDNLPLLSWLVLRGRCRSCGQRISIRYPAVEALTAALFVAAVVTFGITPAGGKACLLAFLSEGLIFMDAETGLLPAEFTYTGLLAGLVLAWFIPVDTAGTVWLSRVLGWHLVLAPAAWSLADATLAAMVGAGFFVVAWVLYYLVRRRDGLGFGDIAFSAMIGAFLGFKLEVLVLFLSPVLGAVFGVGLLLTRPRAVGDDATTAQSPLQQAIPFGVFLGVSALVALYFGEAIWRWYLSLFV